jgi:hypothetical protein
MANQYTNLTPVVDMSDLNRKDFTRKEWLTEYQRRHRKTEQRKQITKKYSQSEKGKATIKRTTQGEKFKVSQRRYKQSEKGRANDARYAQSEKGKATKRERRKRYEQSEQGKAANKRYEQSEKGRSTLNRIAQERRAAKLNATPAWYNRNKVNEIFKKSTRKTNQTGKAHTVDHIVPLQGKTVCGLHVQGNLRVILETTNLKKFNQFTPTTEQLVQRLMASDQIKNNVATYPSITL